AREEEAAVLVEAGETPLDGLLAGPRDEALARPVDGALAVGGDRVARLAGARELALDRGDELPGEPREIDRGLAAGRRERERGGVRDRQPGHRLPVVDAEADERHRAGARLERRLDEDAADFSIGAAALAAGHEVVRPFEPAGRGQVRIEAAA